MDKRGYLVRHGTAESINAAGDAARALTLEGRAAFARHAEGLRTSMAVRAVFTSPLMRAQQTAQILGDVLGVPVTVLPDLASGNLGGAQVLALLETRGDGALLVGHNPEMADALARVAGRGVAVNPGTIAEVALESPLVLRWARSPGG